MKCLSHTYINKLFCCAKKFKNTLTQFCCAKTFTKNIKPYDVRIIADGEKGNLDNFVEQIKIEEHPILVEGVEVTFEEPTGEFEYFEVKRGDMTEELGERLDLFRTETQLKLAGVKNDR